jgi:hypothetical protein
MTNGPSLVSPTICLRAFCQKSGPPRTVTRFFLHPLSRFIALLLCLIQNNSRRRPHLNSAGEPSTMDRIPFFLSPSIGGRFKELNRPATNMEPQPSVPLGSPEGALLAYSHEDCKRPGSDFFHCTGTMRGRCPEPWHRWATWPQRRLFTLTHSRDTYLLATRFFFSFSPRPCPSSGRPAYKSAYSGSAHKEY